MIKTDNVWLMLGDCLERMKEIPDGSVDLILTDPPYGMDLTPQRAGGKFKGVKIANDADLGWASYFFNECARVTSAGFFFCSHHCVAEFILAGRAAGFEVKNLLVWDKKQFGMGGNWRPQHELCLLLTKRRLVTKSNSLSNILRYSRTHHSKSVHPTQKPVDLLRELISEPDCDPQTILDPFMGSGSTGVAAMAEGRKFIGIELDPGYAAIACNRIMEATRV